MTSTPDDVGSDLIDAYLIAVENALVAAGAPRADRMQVLQNLEAQIAEMLAAQPMPFSEDDVRAVLNKLEPPSHFAATYGNGREVVSPKRNGSVQLPRLQLPGLRWPVISAVSCALLPTGCLGWFVGGMAHSGGIAVPGFFLTVVGFILTPLALWRAFKQLRACSEQSPDRNLVLKSTIAYGAFAPALVMAVLMLVTHGFALIPFGVVAFLYLQYVLIRRVWQWMSDALPAQAVARKNGVANGDAAVPPINPEAPMPAM